MYSRLPETTRQRDRMDHSQLGKFSNRLIAGTTTTWVEWQRHNDHMTMTSSNVSDTGELIKDPEHTYEKLEGELYHKGNGSEMNKRKVGNNTWLMRDAGRIIVRLHNTDILTYYPDGRVVLNASTWTTQTTKDRMNAFLGWGTIEQAYGAFFANVAFRRYDAAQQKTLWVEARIPFANHMTIDVRTHELMNHPDQRFTKVDDSIVMREAADLSRVLGQETKYLIERLRQDAVTRDDLRHALLMVHTYQKERERLVNQIHRLESAMDWASTTLEDTIEAAIMKHGDVQHERRAKLQKLFDPEEVDQILDDIYRQL
jgi:hypothetical protein